ncbi:amidohydrolase family protein [Rhodococcus sp. NCIMB 12038]|jgi:predicted TIM-barrel fold metal-dependent hydrolase|uniref:amidohydrolase family protein n=1 Tax=Rhodococcus sp. NCIMB 12038 TaxID=933800 RepID=UPI0015C60871|nr:amidohydrolase family protein [Rhodococcus sp. NCIMB 12038]
MTDTLTSTTDDVKIIDCDAHLTEPSDLWTSRVPASMKSKMPQMETRDGFTAWYIDGEMWASIGGNTIGHGPKKVLGTNSLQPFEEIHQSAWSTRERLEVLDDQGVLAQVLYPNGVGFSSNHIFAVPDLDQRSLILKTYNDFLVEVQHESNNRLLPQAMLPIWDMDLTVKEMTRMIDQGITGFTLSDKPELLDLPELPEPYFDPMWDVFNSTNTVANFHIGAGGTKEEVLDLRKTMREQRAGKSPTPTATTLTGKKVASPSWRSFGPQRWMAVMATQMYMSNVRIVTNLCMSNLFDRYPNLKVVSAESGIGWVPFLLEALEYQLDEMVTTNDEMSLQKRRPTEYFRDHLYVMFWFESSAPQKLVEDIGAKNILVETDIPHPTCLYPNAKGHFDRVLGGLDDYSRRRILQDNAAELYGIDIPALTK